uniref:PSP proline-rich domain-containing protein n=1 Tax=Ascaris suum TaxID=6253 RepID=F1KZP8_ASCSU
MSTSRTATSGRSARTVVNGSPKSEGSRESGECSSSSSSSPVLINVVQNRKKNKADEYPSEDSVLLLSDDSDIIAEESSDDSVQLIDSENDDGLFVLDKSGSVDESCTPTTCIDESNKSSTNKTFKHRSPPLDISKVLTSVVTPSPTPEKKESLFKMKCFNCGGEHMLDKCDIPHDARRIAKNRADYYNGRRSMTERYLDSTANSNIKPGRISDELREALGIGPRDIPEWIYRMRRLGFVDGYPPAYLKQAIAKSADTLLEFHTEDAALQSDRSETPRKSTHDGLPPRIDVDKMIYYGGFNYHSHHLRDRERNFRVPDFHEFVDYHQLLLNERFWAEQNKKPPKRSTSQPFNKRKANSFEEKRKRQRKAASDDEDVRIIDMDVESDTGGDVCIESSAPGTSAHRTGSDPVATGEDCVITPKRVKSSPELLGSSSAVVCGTPIGIPTSQRKKPGLDKFRDGVVPFTHEPEDTPHRGFFTNLMKKIRRRCD